MFFWTITTDPKVIDAGLALRTLQKRWNNVNRSAKRISPGFKYFKVIELTKKGFPHVHFLTDQYIDWDKIRKILVLNKFGHVVHFKELPTGQAVKYAIKYIAKHMNSYYYNDDMPSRIWTSSQGLLPMLSSSDGRGDWTLLFLSSDEGLIRDMYLNALELLEDPRPPPSAPGARADPFQW